MHHEVSLYLPLIHPGILIFSLFLMDDLNIISLTSLFALPFYLLHLHHQLLDLTSVNIQLLTILLIVLVDLCLVFIFHLSQLLLVGYLLGLELLLEELELFF